MDLLLPLGDWRVVMPTVDLRTRTRAPMRTSSRGLLSLSSALPWRLACSIPLLRLPGETSSLRWTLDGWLFEHYPTVWRPIMQDAGSMSVTPTPLEHIIVLGAKIHLGRRIVWTLLLFFTLQ